MRRTWKRRQLGADAVRKAVAAAGGNRTKAAQQLGICRETLSRWLSQDTKTRLPTQPKTDAGTATGTFSEWAFQTFNFSRAEVELVRLAQAALDLANDPTAGATVRLHASAQYRALLRDLRLPVETEEDNGHGDIQATTRGNVRQFRQRAG